MSETTNIELAIVYVSGVVAAWNAVNFIRYTEPYITIGEEVLSW
jgi:hypothetical protein